MPDRPINRGAEPHRTQRLALPLALLLALGVSAQGCRSKRAALAPSPSNLLVITVDTLRPDALGWVSGGNATPAIDRLAKEGFAFPAAVAPVPLTFPSHCALMTGLLPRRLGLRDNGQVLGQKPATLAERLHQRGYATAAFVSGYPLASTFGLNRGFDVYDDALTPGGDGELERTAGATADAAQVWLSTARAPWFAWVHFYDPHYPYEPPAAYRREGRRGAYDGEVAYTDAAIGQLRALVEGLGPAPVLTVFAGDHGESLGEHGEGTHGFFIYDSTVVVPLIFHCSGRVRPGLSRAAVRLIDVAPTVLDLLGAAPPEGADGVSLQPLLAGGAPSDEPAYVETYQPWSSYGWSPLRAVRHRGWKLISAPRPELFDLETDPREERNRIADAPEQARGLQKLLARTVGVPTVAAETVKDPEALARLRALGYLGGGAQATEPPAQGLRDPKDGAELRELLTQGDQLLRHGQYRGAVGRFEAALARDPENRFALHRSGLALLQQGDVAHALPRLEKAVRLNPQEPDVRWALAQALTRARRYEAAIEQWTEATRLQPRRAEAWANLGSVLGLSGKAQEAVSALAHAVELEPTNPRLLARLAFAEHAAGRLADTARHLRTAAEASSAGEFSHPGALGLVLIQLGRPDEARRWLAASTAREPEFAEAHLELARLEAQASHMEEARAALRQALRAAPTLRARAAADARLAPLMRP